MIIPAIDIQNGEAVRLYRGDYTQKTVYGRNPAEIAARFENMGAKYLHVVDLDGAKEGRAVNTAAIRAIRERVRIPMQVGGGIRNTEAVAYYLNELGINRVILGTSAINSAAQNTGFARTMLATHGAERIVFGVDIIDGKVKTGGWLHDGGINYRAYMEELAGMGARYIVLTDISRDGTLTAPNWSLYTSVKDITGLRIIVSGGVSSERDIQAAGDYYGVIVGKAYYEGKVDLAKMLKKRIVACLDIINGKVVKGVHFVDMTEIGGPAELARQYETQGADEIVLLDITATNEGRDTFYPLIERVSAGLTVPVTVGGGIRTLRDIEKVLAAGADKVSLNSAFVRNPSLIAEAAAAFGKHRIVAAIDGKKVGGDYHVFVRGGREDTGLDLIEWARQCEALGAGEILLTSMDGDGTQNGYDIPMTKAVVDSVSIPVTASGGCGKIEDIHTVFNKTACDAALVASLLHYGKATIADIKASMEREHITGLIPAIVQDYHSGRVLMLAYVNQESYDYMRAHGETCFWSRSRQALWHKGATSGNKQKINSMSFDCDRDTLLIQVTQTGTGACHTGSYSCFGDDDHAEYVMADTLYALIKDRLAHPVDHSYTNYLFDKGIDKMLKKVGEEAAEVIIAAKNDQPSALVGEIADLAYHLLVMMCQQNITPGHIRAQLAERRRASS